VAAANAKIIGVVGAGVMGRGIVQLFAQAGHVVRMFDAREGAAAEAKAIVTGLLERLVAKGLLTQAAFAENVAKMQVCQALDELAGCAVVVEAIIEDLEAKQGLFRALEAVVGAETILASNTSSLTVSGIAANCEKPARVAGLHFFNPVPLMKIAEIIPGIRTAPRVVDELRSLIEATGHRTVTASDQPGFLINHAGRGLYGEGFRIVEEGVADFTAVDRIMRDCCGFRMGPFELMDLTGLDVSGKVMQSIFEQFQHEPRYRPSSLVPPRLAAGLFGRKTGEGFYKYEGSQKIEHAETVAPTGGDLGAVWVGEGERRAELLEILSQAGASIADAPAAAAVLVLMPWGEDVTTAALQLGLAPSKTVGVDPFGRWDRRRVLMTSPVTLAPVREALHAMLAADGAAVTVIADSPGFVSQRVIAMIVNIACEIAQRGIARAAEIDPAIRIGLGYPKGPLELGDSIGGPKILEILETIQATTGDPRYRPSLWLRRRAMLGVSLLWEAGA
jgi:3-hydroxybutyryl-CoA dehydrogenase